jgi:hypothetical protein
MGIDDYSKTFEVGDLVRFIGFNYTPDYYVPAEYEDSIGIIISTEANAGVYIKTSYTYRVHWFRTGESTIVVASHLMLVPGFRRARDE